MKNLNSILKLGFVLLAAGAGSVFAAVNAALPAKYQHIRFPDWTYIAPDPAKYRVELVGGAIAFLVPDSTLDLIKVSLLSGAPNQPTKPQDVANIKLYSSLLKSGGAAGLNPDKLEDSLEFVAAEMGAVIDDWQGSATLDCLSGNANELLKLIPDLVLKPRLDSAVFRVQQRGFLENLRHRYDTPRGVMGVAYEKVMHGSHPSNWLPTEAEVSASTPKALSPMIGRGFSANHLVFAVAGRFDKVNMIQRLNELVKRFPQGAKLDSVRPFSQAQPPGVYLIDKPFAQATLKLGCPGVQRPNPDYYRLLVASYIFGDGGFTSRLVEKVRSNEGLAYGIDSDVESDYNRQATVTVGLQTKVETGAYAISLVIAEMKRMVEGGITQVELDKAKDGLLKSLPSMFDSPGATARIFAQGEIWHRKPDHFLDFEKTIKTMTKTEVETAFKRYFNPDSLRIVVVGPKTTLMAKDAHGLSLETFGKVTEINTTALDSRD
jgi:zinc protease